MLISKKWNDVLGCYCYYVSGWLRTSVIVWMVCRMTIITLFSHICKYPSHIFVHCCLLVIRLIYICVYYVTVANQIFLFWGIKEYFDFVTYREKIGTVGGVGFFASIFQRYKVTETEVKHEWRPFTPCFEFTSFLSSAVWAQTALEISLINKIWVVFWGLFHIFFSPDDLPKSLGSVRIP